MSQSHKFERLDFDVVWSALSRSTKLKRALEDAAKDVAAEAEQVARRVAYDTGNYATSFDTASATGQRAREAFNTTARRRRGGKQKTNRFIERTDGDPDGGAYDGTIATVFNTDFKAILVEFGSMAKGPRMVMATAAKNVVASLPGASYEQLYTAAYQQNLSELSRRISEGLKRRGARG